MVKKIQFIKKVFHVHFWVGFFSSFWKSYRQKWILRNTAKMLSLYQKGTNDVLISTNNVNWCLVPITTTDFCFFDEKDKYVANIEKYFFKRFYHIPFHYQKPSYPFSKVFPIENGLEFKSKGLSNDWAYLYTEKISGDFKLDFDLILKTEFKEFQIAFKHQSLFERLRFRIVENKKLEFEVVSSGVFYNHLIVTPCSLEINKKYHVCVIVFNYQYSFILDDKPLLIINDYHHHFKKGGLAIVTWDQLYPSEINCEILNFNINIHT